MARDIIRTFTDKGENWRLVRTGLGLLVEGPLQRFVLFTPAAAKAIGLAIVSETAAAGKEGERAAVIEECARVAHDYKHRIKEPHDWFIANDIAECIRSLSLPTETVEARLALARLKDIEDRAASQRHGERRGEGE